MNTHHSITVSTHNNTNTGTDLNANALFEWPIRIYWEDTDAGGIVYHAKYIHFFERARTEWLRQHHIEQHAIKTSTGGMFVVQSLNVVYRNPAVLDDVLITRTVIESLGNASCVLRQTIGRRDDNHSETMIAEATIRLGFVDSNNNQPMRLPALVYSRLEPLLP